VSRPGHAAGLILTYQAVDRKYVQKGAGPGGALLGLAA
jgi:hypothetical protein